MTCRPAVVLSYTVAAAAALLSGLCYTEFVVDLPTAGGAFNYVSVVFGEFTAWSVLPDPQKHKFLHSRRRSALKQGLICSLTNSHKAGQVRFNRWMT